MAAPNAYYAIQPAFTGGEISPDVASRVDLDKYQLALLQAENAIIRPYGAVRKRPGLIYCGSTKNDGKAVLRKFDFASVLDYMLEIGAGYIRIWRDGKYLGVEVETPFTEGDLPKLRFAQSGDRLYICSGAHPVKQLSRYAEDDWKLEDIPWQTMAYGDLNLDDTRKVTPSGTEGNITLTASGDIFDASRVGDSMKLEQYVDGRSVTEEAAAGENGADVYTETIPCGDSWKIITHGTWTGTVYVQISKDKGATWRNLRYYGGKDDYNPMESGDVAEPCLLRLHCVITSGTCRAELSTYPYTADGYVKITGVTDAKTATAEVLETLGDTSATADWYWAAWSEKNGYPYCVTFFQDRLVFGGCKAYPQRVWMSRSGDYTNFKVEKESGTVTDDSAITADLLSQQSYTINHMDAGNDLVIMTDGNLWTIVGSETVTPSNITPRKQEVYGTNDVMPVRVGSRVIYVQRRGSIIRDTGYDYSTDSYAGQDLTLLAKHLIEGRKLVDVCYMQEPDSLLCFVTDDGKLLCLTYVPEQRVYGWSHFVTDGAFESVCSVASGNRDTVYAIVQRDGHRYIEQFDIDRTSESQQDYCMMDSAVIKAFSAPQTAVEGLGHLEGKSVWVMGDGYLYEGLSVQKGKVTLPEACAHVTVGLPYTEILEQPNWDAGATQSGTVQGRSKYVSTAILRLSRSFGGAIGPDAGHLNTIIYDSERLQLGEDVLYSGDKEVNLAAGGFNKEGRTYIKHDTPYPFSVSAIIREVTFGG